MLNYLTSVDRHLHRNKIEIIEPEAFKNLQNLQQLYVHELLKSLV